MNYKEYKTFNIPEWEQYRLSVWAKKAVFQKSIDNRDTEPLFIFYEGPPSANGKPGIHHVMARTIKDVFCRYKTLKGYQVPRQAGWDAHGLPIELAVEKALNITKDDIGRTITVQMYNQACRAEVAKHTDVWNQLTTQMGYWVDLKNPYITCENTYIESLWYLIKTLYVKKLVYKGHTIQPYSPAAGTGLSSHELNQPGCYKLVKDTTIVAQFKAIFDYERLFLAEKAHAEVFLLAWTTTPWTLPANTALAVGKNIVYSLVNTFNSYTYKPISVLLASNLLPKYFSEKQISKSLNSYKEGDQIIPCQVIAEVKGQLLAGMRYNQLMPYSQPTDGDAFKVILADFVTTKDGTGIVHMAPSFGADDYKAAKQNGIGSLTLVDKKGRFVPVVTTYAGRYVKDAYYSEEERNQPHFQSVDVAIAIALKKQNKAFKVEKYEHSYPHCWRTDKPILYYPLDSWFIKTTAVKDRLVELNKTINWKPVSTGTGRFGNWLENLVDWNLSRSRYWGTPLPIWRNRAASETLCIGSKKELKEELKDAIASDLLSSTEKANNIHYLDQLESGEYDLHRPYVDNIVLISNGEKLYRESEVLDAWFDSGAMPYASLYYPFGKYKNEDELKQLFPADFIAEGVDQTRGWFFTLHTLGVLLFDSIAFKNVISNGLVLDQHGQKMSKRLGNGIEPLSTLKTYGADTTRWYMISNAAAWDNLKFSLDGLAETRRKFFSTLHNTYAFFALYANIDQFSYKEAEPSILNRPDLDRWILSLLHNLIQEVDKAYQNYEATKVARAIQYFVNEHLSNWYVRLSRRRFWKGEYSSDKISAYQTLYQCLEQVALLMSPIAPFYSDQLFTDLNQVTNRQQDTTKAISVHLNDFPSFNQLFIDTQLETSMKLAQDLSSVILSLRKKAGIKVRQRLGMISILLPIPNQDFKTQVERVKDIILSETNIKTIQYTEDVSDMVIKKAKPNFKLLGPKAGSRMKEITTLITAFTQTEISLLESHGSIALNTILVNTTQPFKLLLEDVEIISEDIPGLLVSNMGSLTVALDITIDSALKQEGLARELVNRIQNLRKEQGLAVTDTIIVQLASHDDKLKEAVKTNIDYISNEILAQSLDPDSPLDLADCTEIEIAGIVLKVNITKTAL